MNLGFFPILLLFLLTILLPFLPSFLSLAPFSLLFSLSVSLSYSLLLHTSCSFPPLPLHFLSFHPFPFLPVFIPLHFRSSHSLSHSFSLLLSFLLLILSFYSTSPSLFRFHSTSYTDRYDDTSFLLPPSKSSPILVMISWFLPPVLQNQTRHSAAFLPCPCC